MSKLGSSIDNPIGLTDRTIDQVISAIHKYRPCYILGTKEMFNIHGKYIESHFKFIGFNTKVTVIKQYKTFNKMFLVEASITQFN